MKRLKFVSFVLLIAALMLMAGCGENTTDPQTGTINVTVLDITTNQPVRDVEIIIMPGNLIRKTGEDGKAVFQIESGEYFVDAQVCCAGPGFIQYHEPIMVSANKSVEITLNACLICL